MLRIRVLGQLELAIGDEPLVLPDRRRARALLAWLVLHPGAHSRIALAGRFWPDVDETRARESLRTTLAALRRSLGSEPDLYLRATREEIGLAGADLVWVDALEFETLVAAGREQEALGLCRGELLQDLTDDWIEQARQEHRERVRAILDELSAHGARATDYEEAADNYELAARAYSELPEPDAEKLLDLLLAGARMRLKAGQTAGVRETLLRAADLARQVGSARKLASVALGLGAIPHFPGPGMIDAPVVAIAQDALEGLGDREPALKAMLLAQLAREHMPSGEARRVEELSATAIATARRSRDPAALALALQSRHMSLAGSEDFASRRTTVDELVEAADASGKPEMRLWSRVWGAVELLEEGELEAFRALSDQFAQLAKNLNEPAYAWWPALWHTCAAVLAGSLGEGERLAQRAFALGWESQGESAQGQLNAQLLCIRWQQGRLGELEQTIDSRPGGRPELLAARAARALVHAQVGRIEEARSEATDVVNDLTELGRESQLLVTGTLLAETCASTGDREAADLLYTQLLPHAGRFAVAGYGCCCFGPVSTSLGMLATQLDRATESERHFTEAVAACESIGAPLLLEHAMKNRMPEKAEGPSR